MKFPTVEEITKKYGKHDLERLGLFMEMPYLSRKSRPIKKQTTNTKPNLLSGGPKSKCGNSDGYFEEFKRIFSKEAIKDRHKKPPKAESSATTKKPYLPPGATKQHSTPGDYYGCFSGIIEAFSRRARPQPPRQPAKKNFLTNPARKGGPGYVDICLNKYPEHKSDRYKKKPTETPSKQKQPYISAHRTQSYFEKNPFFDKKSKRGPVYIPPKERPVKVIKPGYFLPTGPAKLQGGCHAGCFEKYPEHKSDRKPKKKTGVETETKIFYPPSRALKTLHHRSVVLRNVDFRVNAQNYRNFGPIYLKYIRLN